MNVWEALQQGRSLLAQVSDEGDIEAEMLLRECLSLDRTRLYARLGEELSTEQEEAYRGLIVRRMVYEPAAYILGHKEFFGLEFEVTPAAIIPRPETERLVEIAIDFLRRQAGLKIADVGTGCGAIAVSIAHAVPEASIVAVDLSADALALAQRNAERHRVQRRIRFVQGDLVAPLDGDRLRANRGQSALRSDVGVGAAAQGDQRTRTARRPRRRARWATGDHTAAAASAGAPGARRAAVSGDRRTPGLGHRRPWHARRFPPPASR